MWCSALGVMVSQFKCNLQLATLWHTLCLPWAIEPAATQRHWTKEPASSLLSYTCDTTVVRTFYQRVNSNVSIGNNGHMLAMGFGHTTAKILWSLYPGSWLWFSFSFWSSFSSALIQTHYRTRAYTQPNIRSHNQDIACKYNFWLPENVDCN